MRKKYNPDDDSYHSKSESRSRSRDKEKKRQHKYAGRPSKKKIQEREQNVYNHEEQSSEISDIRNMPEYQEDKPYMTLIQNFIVFFSAIGEDKGMVFTENERKEFINKAGKDPLLRQMNWNAKHEWKQEEEKDKILKIGEECSLNLRQKKYSSLYQTLIGVSPIFASEFTKELYQVLLNVFLISIDEPLLQERSSKKEMKEENQNFLQEFNQKVGKDEELLFNEEGKRKENQDDENRKLQRLQKLTEAIRNNSQGKYFGFSFQFKKIKARATQRKKAAQQSFNKEQAYSVLLKDIYKVMKTIIEPERI